MLRQERSPWWAEPAHWAFNQHFAKINLHTSYFLANPHIPTSSKKLPQFWSRVLQNWAAVKGNVPVDIGTCSKELLLGLSLEHPTILIPTRSLKDLWTKLQKGGPYTLGDTFIRNPETGAAISKDNPTVELLVKAWAKGHNCLNPELVR
ncbi:hypothetical protein GGI26_004291 [Coemansia sp. RSA 1358]|uniref:Uncharacterized protein n=1 Tax=Coemansia umbellata TaxID=1424467 RepID=A0ABQ8PR06_9FUNG|nr:hypothetical protein EDC05_001668 [Coemansia umbellata]KAJ2621218.1 hypothetical protein GGI26_004291 [Coemansia sp. RSA 1358]